MAEEYLTDDEQLESFKRWFAENWAWALAGVVLGLTVLFGYRFFDDYRNGRALRAAVQFGEMTGALQRSDRNASRRIADGLIKDYASSPYADQARLTIARLYVDEGQLGNAIAPLTQVMNDSKDSELKHIARLRLARILTDQGKPDEAIKMLAQDSPGAFAARYREVRGDALYVKKDFTAAAGEYRAALAAGEAGGVDAAFLELKIADLAGSTAPAATAASTDTSNKAKP